MGSRAGLGGRGRFRGQQKTHFRGEVGRGGRSFVASSLVDTTSSSTHGGADAVGTRKAGKTVPGRKMATDRRERAGLHGTRKVIRFAGVVHEGVEVAGERDDSRGGRRPIDVGERFTDVP